MKLAIYLFVQEFNGGTDMTKEIKERSEKKVKENNKKGRDYKSNKKFLLKSKN